MIASINVVIGVIFILYEPLMKYRNRLKTAAGFGLLFISIGVILLTIGRVTFTSLAEKMESDQVLFYKEGIGATAKVYKDKSGDKYLSIDGFPVAGTTLEYHDNQKPLRHMPLQMRNVQSPRLKIKGYGDGGSTRCTTHNNLK